MGGMVLETNMNEIVSKYMDQDKMEKSEVFLKNQSASLKVNSLVLYKQINVIVQYCVRFCYRLTDQLIPTLGIDIFSNIDILIFSTIAKIFFFSL